VGDRLAHILRSRRRLYGISWLIRIICTAGFRKRSLEMMKALPAGRPFLLLSSLHPLC
ncbi:unnamed protein product, partial [Scytosiphon promiscuus]